MTYIVEIFKYLGVCLIFFTAFEMSSRSEEDKSVPIFFVLTVVILSIIFIFGFDLQHKWEYVIKTFIFVSIPLTMGILIGWRYNKNNS